jgi:hypothetical protein
VVAQREDVARADEVAGGGAGVACEGGTMIIDIIFLTPFSFIWRMIPPVMIRPVIQISINDCKNHYKANHYRDREWACEIAARPRRTEGADGGAAVRGGDARGGALGVGRHAEVRALMMTSLAPPYSLHTTAY